MVVRRSLRNQPPWHAAPADADRACPLCGRPLGDGARVEQHHLVPRSQGGLRTDAVHGICHRKIHATFSDRELARELNTWTALRAHPSMHDFIRWVADKSPAFHRRNRTAKRRR